MDTLASGRQERLPIGLTVSAAQKIKEKKYWLTKLSGKLEKTIFPYDYKIEKIPGQEEGSFAQEKFQFSGDIFSRLTKLANGSDNRLQMILAAALNVLLMRYTRNTDIIIGTTITRSQQPVDESKLINTVLPLRNELEEGMTFKDLLMEMRQTLEEANENRNYPFEILLENLDLMPEGDESPLFGVGILLENIHDMRYFRNIKPEMVFSFSKKIDYIEGKVFYDSQLYKDETIRRISTHYTNLLKAVLVNIQLKLSEIDILSEEERKQILFNFNDTQKDYPWNKTIHQLFAGQVEKTPDRSAVFGHGQTWSTQANTDNFMIMTYRELNDQSDKLAGLLMKKGVQVDCIVGIMVERSVEMIIALIGILKSGGAYLPIDPYYPSERIAYMLNDSNAKILIINKSEIRNPKLETNSNNQNKNQYFGDEFVLNFENLNLNSIKGCSRRGLQHSAFITQHSNHLAYVIYTSGSMGKPKGVMVEHRSAVNLLYAMQDKYPFTPEDIYLFKTSYIFDVSLTELFGWTMGGGRLAILEKNGEKDPRIISKWIEWQHVTHINFVPSMFNLFLDFLTEKNKSQLKSLKYIFLAGEALQPAQVKKFRNLNTAIALKNIYGPTEGTVYSSQYSLSEWNEMGNVPIGKPLANIKLYILNKYNYLQPLGIPGELYINGVGVARGYLNNPELTRGSFEKLPAAMDPVKLLFNYHSPRTNYQSPIYKTGDLARWLPDGNIEFLGRIDHQVKIRGFRIELGEIETQLLGYGKIKEAVVLTHEEEKGNKYLCAYVVSEQEFAVSEMKEYLAKELPDYMIPSYFVQLEKIPLTPNGKVDRKALPKLELKAGENYIAPRDEVEKKLVDLWSEILGRDALHSSKLQTSIGIDDNFFDVGGNSLLLIRIISKLKNSFQKDIPFTTMFRYPTIRSMSQYLDNNDTKEFISNKKIDDSIIVMEETNKLFFGEDNV